MTLLDENNPEVSHKWVVFQEYNTKTAGTKRIIVWRCQYLIDAEFNRLYLEWRVQFDEAKLTYKEWTFPID